MRTSPQSILMAACAALAACTVEVEDQTESLVYRDPNTQTFTARVRADRGVDRVDIEAVGAGTARMRAIGNDLYSAPLRLDECTGVAEYQYVVRTPDVFGGTDIDRFPEFGTFRTAVTGLPRRCARLDDRVAHTFTVDDTRDLEDANPGDGRCRTRRQDGRVCTLRAAVMETNALPGYDLIRVPAARYRLTRTGTETDDVPDDAVNDLDLTEGVTIQGINVSDDVKLSDFLTCSWVSTFGCVMTWPTALLDDPGKDRVLPKVDANGIDRVFQVHAGADMEGPAGLRHLAVVGGDSGNRAGGGIRNEGVLVIERVAITGNAQEVNYFGGAGLANFGTLRADEVTFTHNVDGGLNPLGGALHNAAGGEARITKALFAFNQARFSVAVHNDDASASEPAGRLTIENATFFGNTNSPGVSSMVSVLQNDGEADLVFATIAGHRGARVLSDNGTLRLRNSLLVGNTGTLCSGRPTSLGGNVTDDPCNMDERLLAPDLIDVDPRTEGSLSEEGGFLPVYPLSSSRPAANPAVDAGGAPPFPFDDQRGAPFDRRIDGDGDGSADPDAGAFELGAGTGTS